MTLVTCSGSAPPSFLYRSRTARKMRLTISWSVLAWPGGSIAFHFHWIQRAEFVKQPSFSAKLEAGRRYTSVGICAASAVPYSLGAFQNEAVSVSTFSTITSHLSLESAAIHFGELGPIPTGFMPKEMKPSGPGSLPPARVAPCRYMSSQLYIHEKLPSVFGSH